MRSNDPHDLRRLVCVVCGDTLEYNPRDRQCRYCGRWTLHHVTGVQYL